MPWRSEQEPWSWRGLPQLPCACGVMRRPRVADTSAAVWDLVAAACALAAAISAVAACALAAHPLAACASGAAACAGGAPFGGMHFRGGGMRFGGAPGGMRLGAAVHALWRSALGGTRFGGGPFMGGPRFGGAFPSTACALATCRGVPWVSTPPPGQPPFARATAGTMGQHTFARRQRRWLQPVRRYDRCRGGGRGGRQGLHGQAAAAGGRPVQRLRRTWLGRLPHGRLQAQRLRQQGRLFTVKLFKHPGCCGWFGKACRSWWAMCSPPCF